MAFVSSIFNYFLKSPKKRKIRVCLKNLRVCHYYDLFESQQFKIFSLHLCPRVVLPFRKSFSREILSKLVKKIKQLYVLLALAKCYYVTTSFDLWMSKGAYDIYALVINFLGFDGQPKHIAIGLF